MTDYVEATQDEMREILGFPPADMEDLEGLKQFIAFRDLSDYHEGLFRQIDAARILGISGGAMRTYVARGKVDTVDLFGQVWVSGLWIRRRLENPPATGRPAHKTKS